MPDRQFHYLGPSREQLGPVPESELPGLIERGELKPWTLVWCEGMDEWKAARETLDLFPKVERVAAPAGGVAQSAGPRQPWGIPAMPPSEYAPGSFMSLFRWYVVLWLFGAVTMGAAAIVMTVVAMSSGGGGPPDELMFMLFGGICLGLAPMLAGAVCWFILVYRCWRQIQDGYAETGPGKAVGFLFIPFFNYYWYFVAWWGLAKDLRAYTARQGVPGPAPSDSLALTAVITYLVVSLVGACIGAFAFPFYLGVIALWVISWYQIARTSDAIAASPRVPIGGYGICPKCRYDLTALPAGSACPECGWTAPSATGSPGLAGGEGRPVF